MDSVDMEVITKAARWLDQGVPVVLVTVVRTWGSSPRPEGSLAAIRHDGMIVGSVSGGCIEDDLAANIRHKAIAMHRPSVVRYGVSADEAHRFGLPCGGTMELVLEPLTRASNLHGLLQALAHGQLVTRTVEMESGATRLEPSHSVGGFSFDGKTLQLTFGPRYRLLVIGGGQLSRYLCPIAAGLDYQVTVCDPREEYGESWDLPGIELVRAMPDDVVTDMKLDSRSAIVALTHDPKLDDLALMEALRTPAFYIGALGSRRNNDARRERLREFDLDDRQLARLRGPVGIYIGSRTPPEIAISILAEITAAKNGIPVPAHRQVRHAKQALEAA
ncbi:XdhC family protein [Burkholderia gladioli]|uniref:XdhC family protein n=1 Tax=Burkholderia gladioli TaxID=28095 RepID=UPI0016418291|nr:XdhC family protein [Burkholderia gladioli]